MEPLPPPTPKRRQRSQYVPTPVHSRSDERKLHSLNIFHVKNQGKFTKNKNVVSGLSKRTAMSKTNHISSTKVNIERPIVEPTPRDSTLQSPRLKRFTEEQLNILDRQVNRIIKQKVSKIYHTLVKRFYPEKIENRVLSHDAAAHRVHAAFRHAVKEYIDVRAIREKVLVQLESIVHQSGDTHDGFGFLLHLGKGKAKGKGKEDIQKKPVTLKDKIQAKKKEIHEQKLKAEQLAKPGKVGGPGMKYWKHIVQKKYWKALKPKIERIKPWEQVKYVNFPKQKIDIRGWKEEKSKRRNEWENKRIEWMHAQFSELHSKKTMEKIDEIWEDSDEDGVENREGDKGEGSAENDDNICSNLSDADLEIEVDSENVTASQSPTVVAFNAVLSEHTKREKPSPISTPFLHSSEEYSKRSETWEEIVTLLQQQGVLRPNFHRLWENDQRKWPDLRPFRPDKPKMGVEKTQDVKNRSNQDDDITKKEWPSRLGRYLLPNYDHVNPASKGTLEDYYSSLGTNAPERALVGVGIRKRKKVFVLMPPWFRVSAATSNLLDDRSPLRTNWLRCEMSAVPSRASIHMPRLCGYYSAASASALLCSSFAPHAWNHSSSTKDSREKWKREHGQVSNFVENQSAMKEATESEEGLEGMKDTKSMETTKKQRRQNQQSERKERKDQHMNPALLDHEIANLVESDQSKSMRWATFLPEGASLLPKEGSKDVDHDLILRNLICKTTYLNLHAVEHHEKERLLDVRTGGEDETVQCAVTSSNPLIFMNREGHHGFDRGGNNWNNNSSIDKSNTSIVPMRISPFPYRAVHRLLKHLKDYVEMGPERLKVTFCPMELMRVLTAVVRAASKYHKKKRESTANGGLSKAAGAELLGFRGAGGAKKKRGGPRGLHSKSKGNLQKSKRRAGIVLLVKENPLPPKPLDYTVADRFIWSTELLQYSTKDRLSLIIKYTTNTNFYIVSSIAASYWEKAAVSIDRLEGLAYEISRRAGSEGRVGSIGRFHVTESKVMARWDVLTLLNEFDMTYNTVAGLLAILFVRFHDVVERLKECYAERMTKMRSIMRRELTPAMASTF